MSETYAAAGVDLDGGDNFSAFCYKLAKQTWHNCPFLYVDEGEGAEDYFRGDLGWLPINLPEGWRLDDALDGVGTKSIISVEAFTPQQAAADLIAMTLGDIVRKGGVPLKFGSVLDVRSLGNPGSTADTFFRRAMRGLQKAAFKEHIALYRGETAELGSCIGSENPEANVAYNWAGFATAAKHPKLRIDGSRLAPGQIVIAIRENGFRSNGLSAVRSAFRISFGEGWWNNSKAKPHIAAAAEPSVLWSHFLARMNGWYRENFAPVVPMTAIAHITGGGIPEKFGEDILFRRGLSAELGSLPKPPPIMRASKEWLGMGEEEFFRVFNSGSGALVVVPTKENAGLFIRHASEWGIQAQIAGQITASQGAAQLNIRSQLSGAWIAYFPKPNKRGAG